MHVLYTSTPSLHADYLLPKWMLSNIITIVCVQLKFGNALLALIWASLSCNLNTLSNSFLEVGLDLTLEILIKVISYIKY